MLATRSLPARLYRARYNRTDESRPTTWDGRIGIVIEQVALPAWFAVVSLLAVTVFVPNNVGIDVTNYLGATRAWLSGGDPWTVTFGGMYFAAPPPTLLAVLPFAILPDPLGWWAMFAAGPILAVVGIRLLRLPWWWLMFPPLVVCLCVGNPGAWLPALMFVPPLAVLAKVYAIVPLVILGRWRALMVTGAVLLVSAPLLPWGMFIADWPVYSRNLIAQSQHTLAGPLVLGAIVLGILVIRDRTRAAWLAVPLVWPNSQWSYASNSMPAGWVCVFLALPYPGAALLAGLAAALQAAAGSDGVSEGRAGR